MNATTAVADSDITQSHRARDSATNACEEHSDYARFDEDESHAATRPRLGVVRPETQVPSRCRQSA